MTARLYSMLIISAGGEVSDYIAWYFSRQNYRVKVIADVAQAVKWTRLNLPDIILLDEYTLPDEVFDYALCVRCTPRLVHIPFILLTPEPQPLEIVDLGRGWEDWVQIELDQIITWPG
jgi:DNA-binding response OmpR family regulator